MTKRKNESIEDFRIRKYAVEKARRDMDRESFNAQRRDHYARNTERILDNNRRHRYNDIEAYNAKARSRRNERTRERERQYKKRVGVDKLREMGRKHAAKRRASGKMWKYVQFKEQTDPQFFLARRIRCRIKMAFKKAANGTRKLDTTIKLLGCSFNEFKLHIEKQFKDGMDWEAVLDGRIHIDHIKAVSTFDLTDPLQQKLAFHFSNCQPLWAADNISKGNRVIVPFKAA